MDKFPITKIIVTQKGLRDALTEEIILDYERIKVFKSKKIRIVIDGLRGI